MASPGDHFKVFPPPEASAPQGKPKKSYTKDPSHNNLMAGPDAYLATEAAAAIVKSKQNKGRKKSNDSKTTAASTAQSGKRIKHEDMNKAPLVDIDPIDFDINIIQSQEPWKMVDDIPQDLQCRFGDAMTAICLIGYKFKLFSRGDLAKFPLVFTQKGEVRGSRKHEGFALLDRQGGFLRLGGEPYYGSDATLSPSEFWSVEAMQQQLPGKKYQQWLENLLYYDDNGDIEERRKRAKKLDGLQFSFFETATFDASTSANPEEAQQQAVANALAEARSLHAEEIKIFELNHSAQMAEMNAKMSILKADHERLRVSDSARDSAFRLANEHAEALGNAAMNAFYKSIENIGESAVAVARTFEERHPASGTALIQAFAGKLSDFSILLNSNRELLVRSNEADSTDDDYLSDTSSGSDDDGNLQNKTLLMRKIKMEKKRNQSRQERNSSRTDGVKRKISQTSFEQTAENSTQTRKAVKLPVGLPAIALDFSKRQRRGGGRSNAHKSKSEPADDEEENDEYDEYDEYTQSHGHTNSDAESQT